MTPNPIPLTVLQHRLDPLHDCNGNSRTLVLYSDLAQINGPLELRVPFLAFIGVGEPIPEPPAGYTVEMVVQAEQLSMPPLPEGLAFKATQVKAQRIIHRGWLDNDQPWRSWHFTEEDT